MWPGAKSCCSPDGHCKTKTPKPPTSSRECKQIAFDHQKSVDIHTELSVVSVVKDVVPVPMAEALGRIRRDAGIALIQ
jgi:hypothetical protein